MHKYVTMYIYILYLRALEVQNNSLLLTHSRIAPVGRVPMWHLCVKGLDTFQLGVRSHTKEGTLIFINKQSLELRTELQLESPGHRIRK